MNGKKGIEEPFLEHLDRIWPVYHRAFARLLTKLYALFDGDLDSMFILLTVAVGTERDGWQDALLDEAPQEASMQPINTLSISQVTGIPRETVRRKLQALQAKGWVERANGGGWQPAAAAATDLRPGTLATFEFLKTIMDLGAELDLGSKK